MSETRGALHAFNIPLVAVGHNSGYVGPRNYDNILSTAPDMQGQAEVKLHQNYYFLKYIIHFFRAERVFKNYVDKILKIVPTFPWTILYNKRLTY